MFKGKRPREISAAISFFRLKTGAIFDGADIWSEKKDYWLNGFHFAGAGINVIGLSGHMGSAVSRSIQAEPVMSPSSNQLRRSDC